VYDALVMQATAKHILKHSRKCGLAVKIPGCGLHPSTRSFFVHTRVRGCLPIPGNSPLANRTLSYFTEDSETDCYRYSVGPSLFSASSDGLGYDESLPSINPKTHRASCGCMKDSYAPPTCGTQIQAMTEPLVNLVKTVHTDKPPAVVNGDIELGCNTALTYRTL